MLIQNGKTRKVQYIKNMLFDHTRDKNENNNLAQLPEYTKVIQNLSDLLEQHIEKR